MSPLVILLFGLLALSSGKEVAKVEAKDAAGGSPLASKSVAGKSVVAAQKTHGRQLAANAKSDGAASEDVLGDFLESEQGQQFINVAHTLFNEQMGKMSEARSEEATKSEDEVTDLFVDSLIQFGSHVGNQKLDASKMNALDLLKEYRENIVIGMTLDTKKKVKETAAKKERHVQVQERSGAPRQAKLRSVARNPNYKAPSLKVKSAPLPPAEEDKVLKRAMADRINDMARSMTRDIINIQGLVGRDMSYERTPRESSGQKRSLAIAMRHAYRTQRENAS